MHDESLIRQTSTLMNWLKQTPVAAQMSYMIENDQFLATNVLRDAVYTTGFDKEDLVELARIYNLIKAILNDG